MILQTETSNIPLVEIRILAFVFRLNTNA